MATSEEMLLHEKNATVFLKDISEKMRVLKNSAKRLGKNPSVARVNAVRMSVLQASHDIHQSKHALLKTLPNTEKFRIFHDGDAFVNHVLGAKLTGVSTHLYFLHPDFSRNRKTHLELQDAVSLLHSAQTLSAAFVKIYSRSSERKLVDVRKLLAEAKNSFPSAKGRISISIKGGQHSLGDRELLFKVFHDLISNAVKATSKDPETRKISIVAEQHPFQKEMLVVSVKDNGVGVHSEKMRNLFGGGSSFGMQGVPKGGGTALPLVKKIVEEHGGEIAILSKEGKGTVFAVSLPRIYKK